ncbi:MAG: MFS transporter [Mycetocola reblochoni]|uniref:ABC transporter, permease protein n=2 Tax=Mycetocola reblochoni TaxID=331618 RepID=A0A1R4JW30_9MICO|nr:MFS transporter [Mycetocola reblochoni]RLP68447.1 MFS transporter [Mycetocola reblochoni]SJN35973.1 ABC transporter, permease protein [Mycetocola reblochoni REB411]
MSSYSTLLKTPGVARIISAQLLARFPGGMLSLAILMHVERQTGSYANAGLVLAATSIGQAIAGPLTSRWMGRWGMRPVLLLTTVVCTASVTVIGIVPLAVIGYVVFGLLAGLSTPPVQPAVRTIYPKMVNSSQLTRLFSLDASAQEIIWVLAPVVVTFVAMQISTSVGILVAASILVLGGLWFISLPELGRVRIPRSRRAFGVVLKRPTVLLSTVVGFLMIATIAAVEAGVVANFGHGGSEAGIALAIFAVGSLAGGLALGHLAIGPWALASRIVIIVVGVVLTPLFSGLWGLSAALLIAGFGIAPALAVLFAIVSSTVKFSDTAEAYGWVGTGQLIGAALGSSLAGIAIDTTGAAGAFWVASGFAVAALLGAVIGRRWHPDLRGREVGPIPDTEPISISPSS